MIRWLNFKSVLFSPVFLFGLVFITFTVHTKAQAQTPAYRPGELLIRYKTGHQDDIKNQRIRAVRTLNQGRLHHLILAPSMSVEQAVAFYAQDPDVAFVEPNYYLHAQTSPNDPRFSRQWALVNTGQRISGYAGTPGADIDAPEAWKITEGRAEAIVAVIDTGVAVDHPDLSGAIWTNPHEIAANGIDDDLNGFVDDVHGWDFVDDDSEPMDTTGHGTHVAGIIAAQPDNGMGIAGVAGQVRIMPLRFMDAFERGTIADAIFAINYAVAQGARIINCSWGSGSRSAALEQTMADADALFVCAAGNEGIDNDARPFYPAGFDLSNVLSVAASNQMDQLAWFSNYGRQSVDVAAPGTYIYSLNPGRQVIWADDFNDFNIDDWQTGGDTPGWHVAAPPDADSTPALTGNPDGGYAPDVNTWVISPRLDLSQAAAAKFTFFLIGSSEPDADLLRVEVSTDLCHWSSRPLLKGSAVDHYGISGSVPYWMPVTADLGPWDGAERLNLRFRFSSDAEGEGDGFYVDNLSLTAAAPDGEQYQYMHGTSMAAAFASGVAALVLSGDLTSSPAQVKSIITKSVDLEYGLYGEIAAAGRINACNALSLISDLSLTAERSGDQVSLAWKAAAPLSAVSIERRAEDQTDFQQIAQASALQNSYTDDHLADGDVFYYRVQARTQDGRNGFSPQALAATDLPAAGVSSASGGGGGCFIETVSLY